MEEIFVRKTIQETIEIIESSDKNNKNYLTVLLNSLLSLVVLPVECIKRKQREKIFGSSLNTFVKATGVTPSIFNPIRSIKDGKTILYNRTPQNLVNKLRNGVAHQCIDIKQFKEEKFVIIYNVFNKIKDFEVKVTLEELKCLELYIARCYLRK